MVYGEYHPINKHKNGLYKKPILFVLPIIAFPRRFELLSQTGVGLYPRPLDEGNIFCTSSFYSSINISLATPTRGKDGPPEKLIN